MSTSPSNEATGQDQFKNHRAGYGDRLAWVLDWLEKHPDATLSSGEGALLLAHIRKLEAAAANSRTKATLPALET